jgi:hypothetical protein
VRRIEIEHHIWDSWHDTVHLIARLCDVRAPISQQRRLPALHFILRSMPKPVITWPAFFVVGAMDMPIASVCSADAGHPMRRSDHAIQGSKPLSIRSSRNGAHPCAGIL